MNRTLTLGARFALYALLAGILAACGSTTTPPPGGSSDLTTLAGTWMSGCQLQMTGLNTIESRSNPLQINSNGSFASLDFQWHNTDCSGDPWWMEINSGTGLLTGATLSTPAGVAAKLDATNTIDTATLLDPNDVVSFNASGVNGAYGYKQWALGVPHDILGKDFDNSAKSATDKVLVLVSGSLFFDGVDTSRDASGYPTQVHPSAALANNPLVIATAVDGEWAAACRHDSNPDFNSQARQEHFTFTALSGIVIVTTTYYGQPSCDRTATGTALPQVLQSQTMTFTLNASADLFTERGLATGGSTTVSAASLTPLTGAAANTLANANGALGAYGYEFWTAGVPLDLLANNKDYNGVTPYPVTEKQAAVLQDGRFYVQGGGNSNRPVDGAGYPRVIGNNSFLPNQIVTAASDLAGTWYDRCSLNSLQWTVNQMDFAVTTVTHTEWVYPTPTCTGTPTPNPSTSLTFTLSIGAPVQTDRGSAGQVQLVPTVAGTTLCSLGQHSGNRLFLATPQTAAGATCAPGEYPTQLPDEFFSLETSPVTAFPVASWVSPCHNESVSDDAVEYVRTFGTAFSEAKVLYAATGIGCGTSGIIDSFIETGATVTFGSPTTVAEGAATQVVVTDSTGANPAAKGLVKLLGDLFWTDDGSTAPDVQPTAIAPGKGLRRTF